MPRHQGISPEASVASSHFFRLPFELRTLIYKLVLHSPQGIFVPPEYFKRKRTSRHLIPATPFAWTCRFCGLSLDVRSRIRFHIAYDCRQTFSSNSWLLTRFGPKGHRGPGLSPALLRTCRLIHLEALPILYRSNSLRFEDAAALSAFRWGTDTEQAGFVRNINITLTLGCAEKAPYRMTNLNPWLRYMTRVEHGLAKDFPHLKGVTLTLGRGLALADAKTVRNHLDTFMKYMYRLDWIQLIGLNDVELLGHLKPILERHDEPNGKKEVQVKTSNYENFIGWTNASLWWDLPGKVAPCEIPAFAGDRRHRYRLYRYQDGDDVSYTAGCSFIEMAE